MHQDDNKHRHSVDRRKPARKTAKAIKDRERVRDCDYGDRVRFVSDERVAALTAFIGGGPFGRFLDEDGIQGELEQLDPDARIVRIGGRR